MEELLEQVKLAVEDYSERFAKERQKAIDSYGGHVSIAEENYNSRINLAKEKNHDSYDAICSRVVDLGNFILQNSSRLTEDMVRSFLYLCESLDKIATSKTEKDKKSDMPSMSDLVSQTEMIFKKFNSFVSKEEEKQLALYQNALDQERLRITQDLIKMRNNVQKVNSLYDENVDRVSLFAVVEPEMTGTHEQVDTLYYAAMNKVDDLLDYIEKNTPTESDLAVLNDALVASFELCKKLIVMLIAENPTKYREACNEVIKEVNKVRNKYYGRKVGTHEIGEDGENLDKKMVG